MATVFPLLDALEAEQAVIAGHDWGASVARHAAQLRPDAIACGATIKVRSPSRSPRYNRGVIGLSVPFRARGSTRPTTVMPQTEDANVDFETEAEVPWWAALVNRLRSVTPQGARSTAWRIVLRPESHYQALRLRRSAARLAAERRLRPCTFRPPVAGSVSGRALARPTGDPGRPKSGSQRTRPWREMDLKHRCPVKDQLVETVLFDFPAEARKRTIGGRRSQPRDLGGDLRRDHNLRDDNDRLGWGRRQAQNGGSPDGVPMVRIHLPPAAS